MVAFMRTLARPAAVSQSMMSLVASTRTFAAFNMFMTRSMLGSRVRRACSWNTTTPNRPAAASARRSWNPWRLSHSVPLTPSST